MSEGSGQRYCGNCGTEVRPDTSFCVSCGASLPLRSADYKPTSSKSSPSEQTASPTYTKDGGLVVAASIVLVLVIILALVLGSNSDGVYGIGVPGGSDSGSGDVGGPTYESTVEEQSSSLQDTSTSGYSDYEMAERKIRAEIRTQMDTSSPGYFRYIYYEEPGAPTETNDEIRSNVLAEYGFDCRPVGGGAMDNGRGGGIYQWIYDCNYVGTEDVGEWSDIY